MQGTVICHHGIKGQKWGIRRFQNKDGSKKAKYYDSTGNLNDAGKKKLKARYDKFMKKTNASYLRNAEDIYINAYNKAVDDENAGGAEKFNRSQEKKYGKNYYKRSQYDIDYGKHWDNKVKKYLNNDIKNFIKSDKNYKKAAVLVEQFGMDSWNDVVKENKKKYS